MNKLVKWSYRNLLMRSFSLLLLCYFRKMWFWEWFQGLLACCGGGFLQCVVIHKQPATGTRDYYNYFIIFSKRALEDWTTETSSTPGWSETETDAFRFLPPLMSPGLLHAATRSKTRAWFIFNSSSREISGGFWTLIVDWKGCKYIWIIISCLSRRMCYNPPVLSRFNLSTHVEKKTLKRNHVLLANKRECTY